MTKQIPKVSVPCNGCTACCHDDLIVLHPECGDDPADYQTIHIAHPLTGKPALALDRRADGACFYLGDDGCTIHGNAPAICQEFDCRRFYQMRGNAAIKRMISAGTFSEAVAEAGRKRLNTLPANG